VQNIEFDSLAPDTIEEIFRARRLLEIWTGKAALGSNCTPADENNEDALARRGRELLSGPPEQTAEPEVLGENMEKSRRKVLILHPREAYEAYGQMLHFYAVKNLIGYLKQNPKTGFEAIYKTMAGPRRRRWVNLGGQLISEDDLDRLRADIGRGKLSCWEDIHQRYDTLWAAYEREKQKHAFATLCELLGTEKPTAEQWIAALDEAVQIQKIIRDRVYESRRKDYDNPFRQATFRNAEEMTAAIGTIDQNSFVRQVIDETDNFARTVEQMKAYQE